MECVWQITAETDGWSIYIEVTSMTSPISWLGDSAMVTIGEGHDPSDNTSLRFSLDNPQLPFDDGVVYIVASNYAWLAVITQFYVECSHFEFRITQREETDFCEGDTKLCTSPLTCLSSSKLCDLKADCDDFSDQVDCEACGITARTLTPGDPLDLTLGPGQQPTDCFWLITAPDDCVIEINVRDTSVYDLVIAVGPYVDDSVDRDEEIFRLSSNELRMIYTNVTSVWLNVDLSALNFGDKVVYDIRVTAYRRHDCRPGEFQCQSQKCVNASSVCDDVPDCPVLEDEYSCGVNCSQPDDYQCPGNGPCLSTSRVCDGRGDCPGITDEFDCDRCGLPYITLDDTGPHNILQPIDVSVDCLWLVATSGGSPYQRIRVDIVELLLIDGDPGSWTNEILRLSFGLGTTPYNSDSVARVLANQPSYPYVLSFEGPQIWILMDTVNHRSEVSTLNHLEMSIRQYDVKSCSTSQYACISGELCIERDQLCNGHPNCPEFDDEFGCDSCPDDQLKCGHSDTCVEVSSICNHVNDCPDKLDEENCAPCGQSYFDISTSPVPLVLSSIGYPDPYPVSIECQWRIFAAPGMHVLVTFLDFETEQNYDYVYFTTNSTLVYRLSGDRYPERISAYSSTLAVTFVSDYIITGRGFQLRFEQVPVASCVGDEMACNGTKTLICILPQEVCDERIDCPDGTDENSCLAKCGETKIVLNRELYHLSSPTYRNLTTYPNSITCIWYVTTPSDREWIELTVKTFDVERGYDFVAIGLGNVSGLAVVERLTGTTKIATILFTGSRTVWVRFDTDGSVTSTGFKFEFISKEKQNWTCDPEYFYPCLLPGNSLLCLQGDAFCDGFADCLDDKDEQDCVNLDCGDLFECKGKQQCLYIEQVCDGVPDCKQFKDDERNCDIHRCPATCNCSLDTNDGLVVKCNRGWTPETLIELAVVTVNLELTGANVEMLDEGLFKKLTSLRALSLRNNNMSYLQMNTFDGLINLTSLDISENDIEELVGYVFEDLAGLTDLGMRSLPMEEIHEHAFAGLTQLQRLVLMRGDGTLSGNSSDHSDEAIIVDDNALTDLLSLQTVYVDDYRMCCNFYPLIEQQDCINIELQSPLFNCGRLMPNTVLQAFMWTLGLSALVGNAVVIVWRLHEGRTSRGSSSSSSGSKYVHSFLVLNLAGSDFLMGVYMIIIASADQVMKDQYYLQATEWRNGAVCKMAGVIAVLSSEASVFFITLISVDRYLCIVHPFSRVRLHKTSVWVSVAAIWLAALLLSLLPTLLVPGDSPVYGLSDVCIGLPLLTRPVSYTFTEQTVGDALGDTYLIPVPQGSVPTWWYSIVLFLGVNLVCIVVVVICYVAIFFKVKRSIRRVRKHSRKDDEIRMATKMAVIVGSDCLCWLPVIVLGILSQTSTVEIGPEAYAWLVAFVLPINSSLNPYLYTIVTAFNRRQQAHRASLRSGENNNGSARTKNGTLPMQEKNDYTVWTMASRMGSVSFPTSLEDHQSEI